MTFYSAARPRRSGPFAGIPARLRAASDDYAKWRLYRRTLTELADLNERELADLGLTRGTVVSAARASVYG